VSGREVRGAGTRSGYPVVSGGRRRSWSAPLLFREEVTRFDARLRGQAASVIICPRPFRLSLGELTLRLGQESVTDTSNRDQVPGPSRIVLDVTPQPNDKIVDRARVCVFLQAPDFLQN
jgi:hypothetical protein